MVCVLLKKNTENDPKKVKKWLRWMHISKLNELHTFGLPVDRSHKLVPTAERFLCNMHKGSRQKQKRLFYVEADPKGGGAGAPPPSQTISICENLGPFLLNMIPRYSKRIFCNYEGAECLFQALFVITFWQTQRRCSSVFCKLRWDCWFILNFQFCLVACYQRSPFSIYSVPKVSCSRLDRFDFIGLDCFVGLRFCWKCACLPLGVSAFSSAL